MFRIQFKTALISLMLFSYFQSAVESKATESKRNSICKDHNICQASGICSISAQRYKCKCPIGRSGELCEISLDPCSFSPCQHRCSIINDLQFECLPSIVNGNILAYKQSSMLLKKSDQATGCESFGLCLNGGRCYTGYRNSRSLIFKCFCPKGYAGLNCQLKHAFGHDSRQIFQALKDKFEAENQPRDENPFFVQHRQYRRNTYEYAFINGFGKTFLLLNTEVSSNSSIGKIEFHAAKKGHFIISFIEVSGCDPDTQPCAQKLHDLHIRINNPETDEQTRYNLSIELEKMLNNSESYLISGEQGFNSYDFSEPIVVNKGSILCITQIDGRLGGILSKEYHSGDLPDLMIVEKNLSNQLFTSDISNHISKNDSNERFFSVLVIDKSLVDVANTDNVKLSFKSSNMLTTLSSGLECVNSLCLNGGSCVSIAQTDSYKCSCPNNTFGNHCEILAQQAPAVVSTFVGSSTIEPTTTALQETTLQVLAESHADYLEKNNSPSNN